jgi:hypothetical protein
MIAFRLIDIVAQHFFLKDFYIYFITSNEMRQKFFHLAHWCDRRHPRVAPQEITNKNQAANIKLATKISAAT